MKFCKGDSEKLASGIFIVFNIIIFVFAILLTAFSLIILNGDDNYKIKIQCDNAEQHHENLEIGCLLLTAAGSLLFMIAILGIVTALVKYKFYLLVVSKTFLFIIVLFFINDIKITSI